MKKIKKINIKYFQTHEDTVLDFADGITVLVGKTDSGKTAIIRSLKLITKNKPRGNGFISAFAPKDKKNKPTTKITLTLDDDTEIIRTKSENKNEYIIKNSEKEEAYNNFGINIPPEIEETIGSTSVKIDQDTYLEVNISEQLSQPFLLFESPTVKTKLIDKIARINVLNRAIKNTKTQVQEIKVNQKKLIEELEDKKETLTTFSNLDKEKEHLLKIKELFNKIKEKQKLLEIYKKNYENFIEIESSINKCQNIKVELNTFLSFSANKIDTLKNKYQQLLTIQNLNNTLNHCIYEINEVNNILAKKDFIFALNTKIQGLKDKNAIYKNVFTKANDLSLLNKYIAQEQSLITENKNTLLAEEKLTELKNKVLFKQKLENMIMNLNSLNNSIITANQFIPEQKQKVQQAINNLNELYKTIQYCPVCKRPFNNDYNNCH